MSVATPVRSTHSSVLLTRGSKRDVGERSVGRYAEPRFSVRPRLHVLLDGNRRPNRLERSGRDLDGKQRAIADVDEVPGWQVAARTGRQARSCDAPSWRHRTSRPRTGASPESEVAVNSTARPPLMILRKDVLKIIPGGVQRGEHLRRAARCAGTTNRPLASPGANTIEPSSPQLAPSMSSALHSTTTGPPATGTFLISPMRPKAESTDCPARRTDRTLRRRRRPQSPRNHRAVAGTSARAESVVNARVVPSGEMQTARRCPS